MDLNNFGPFSFDVWGSVSDWLVVSVTAATGVLIWKTLKSQTEVLRLQQKQTEMSEVSFRSGTHPLLEAIFSGAGHPNTQPKFTTQVSFMLKNIGNYPAHDIKLIPKHLKDDLQFYNYKGEELQPTQYTQLNFVRKETLEEVLKSKPQTLNHFSFATVLEFKDKDGREYNQTFGFEGLSNRVHMVPLLLGRSK